MESKVNRRQFCTAFLRTSTLLAGTVAGCAGPESRQELTEWKTETPVTAQAEPVGDPCTDFSGIELSEVEKRNALGYVDKSPIPDNLCENCKLFIPGKKGDSCGKCMLFKGPVFLYAYCTYWADSEI